MRQRIVEVRRVVALFNCVKWRLCHGGRAVTLRLRRSAYTRLWYTSSYGEEFCLNVS